MANSAARLLTLILLLERQPGRKAAELAKELDVSIRTLHRYISELDEMGIPIYSERGPYGGFSLVRGYKMPPLIFTPEEAAAVFLGASMVGELWGKVYQQAAQSALVKLDNILPDDQRQEAAWARRSLIVSDLHRFSFESLTPTLEIIRRALHENQQIEIVYQGPGHEQPVRRLLDPYALVFRWGWWYVAGYCHLRQARRIFRVDRIQDIHLTSAPYQIPSDFNIKTFLATEPQPSSLFTAHLLFRPDAAPVARSLSFNWSEMQEQSDHSILTAMPVYDLDYSAQMVLGFGPLLTVLDPPALRQRVVEYLQSLLEHYQNDFPGMG